MALEAAFHAPDDRAFGCPEEQPKPRGAAVGEATFDGVRRRQYTTRRRWSRAKTPKRRPRSEVASMKAPPTGAAVNLRPARSRRVQSEGTRTDGNQAKEEWRTRSAKAWFRSPNRSCKGSGTRLGPTCWASCNPLSDCRFDVT